MKKIFKTFLFVYFVLLNCVSAIAPEVCLETAKGVHAITPLTNEMDNDEKIEVSKNFLNRIITDAHQIFRTDLASKQTYQIGWRQVTILTLKDQSQWVLGSGGIQRFLGYQYLDQAIKHYHLEHFCVAETKLLMDKQDMNFTIDLYRHKKLHEINLPVLNSNDVISFSQDVGDERVSSLSDAERREFGLLQDKISFTDMPISQAGYANLRRYNGKIYIFDTEYGSFSLSPVDANNAMASFTYSRIS